MKTKLSFLVGFYFILLTTALAQSDVRYCSYEGAKFNKDDICAQMGYKGTDEVEKLIDGILEQVGLERNFGVLECTGINNCMAYRQGNFQYIIFDPGFLSQISSLGFTERNLQIDWPALSILAHEVGHLLNQHLMVSRISNHKNELEADRFSGFVLAKLGATLEQAQRAMRNAQMPEEGTYTHPPRRQRLAAIEKGWRKGGGNKINETNSEDEKTAIRELAEAKRLFFAGNYDEAYRLHYKYRFHPLFDDSHMYNIGYMYDEGQGVTQDNNQALKWYTKAANKGNSNAMNNIGHMYHEGHGITQDYEEALHWYRKAANKGNGAAMNNIGYMYFIGKGVTQDYAQAKKWYRKAANKGYSKAMLNIGYMYYIGQGVTQDYTEALKWCRKAADKGDTDAQKILKNW